MDWSTLVYPDDAPTYLDDNDRVRTEYSEDGRVNASIDERGNRTEYRYDAVGRLVETIYADETPGDLSDNPRMSITYDAGGRRVAETDALGHTTRYQYDDLGRVTDTIFHDGSRTQVAYDELGRRTSMTDPEGYTTTYQYDALGRLTGVLDALGQLTQYRYDELGRLIEAEDANGHITAYEYDRLGRRIAVELPLEQRSSMTYDAVGNLVSMTDFNGEVTAYGYDAQDRLILTDYEDDADVSYSYCGCGQLNSITDGRGITSFDYDHQGRLLSRQDPDGPYLPSGNTIEYSYDEAGNRTSVTTPNGSVTYGYDERNRLTTVLDDDLNLTTYTYDDVNNLIQTQFGNGVIETREYDDLNRLISLENKQGETILSSYSYELNDAGHRLSVTEYDGRTVSYTYDELHRLTEENINGGDRTIAYTYDNVGNRLSRTDSVEGTTTYIYDANDRLLSETLTQDGSTVQTVNYGYDTNGNLTSRVQDTNGTTETTSYTWNDDNRLVRAELPNGDVATYEYDSEGIRVSSTVNGETTEYLIDKNRPYAQVLEEFRSEQLQAFYVYGHDLISQERGIDTTFYQVDGLGSTRILTDETGNLTDSYDYEAFGELIESSGDTENSYRFAGEQFDETLGDYYLRQRYYDADTGRFTRRDTWEGDLEQPLSLHKYTYVHADPVNGIDPSGLYKLGEQVFTMDLLSRLVTTAYIVVGFGANSAIGSLLGLSATQIFALNRANLGRFIPLMRRDEKGCFSTETPRFGGSLLENSGLVEPREWYQYATQVSGTDKDFLAVTKEGILSTFDGRTPGTRKVWEAKYKQGSTFFFNYNPRFTDDMKAAKLAEWTAQKNDQYLVSNKCNYNLTWSFSEFDAYYLADDAWTVLPPKPNMQHQYFL